MKDINKDEDKTSDKDDEKEEVKSGKLTVSVNRENSKVTIANTWIAILDSISLSSDEDVTINSVNVKINEDQLANRAAVKAVWFEKDSERVSSKKTMSSNEVEVNFSKGFTIKKSDEITLVAEIDGNGIVAFEITDVNSTAENVKIKEGLTSIFETTSYTAKAPKFNIEATGTWTYNYGTKESVELGKFSLENKSSVKDNRTLSFNRITFRNEGTADLSNLEDVEIVKPDGTKVSSKFSVNGRELSVLVNDKIGASETTTYYVKAKLAWIEQDGETYQLSIRNKEDIIVSESSRYRLNAEIDSDKNNFKTYIIKGGDFMFIMGDNLSTISATTGDVVTVAKATLQANGTANIESKPMTGMSESASIVVVWEGFDAVKNIRIKIGKTTYTLDVVMSGDNAKLWTQWIMNGKNFAYTNDDIRLPEGNSDVEVIVELANNLEGKDKVTIDAITTENFWVVRYDHDIDDKVKESEVSGVISCASISMESVSFYIDRPEVKTTSFVYNKSNGKSIFKGSLVNDSSRDIIIDTVRFSLDKELMDKEVLNLSATIGDTTVNATKMNASNQTGTVDGKQIRIPAKSSKQIEVSVISYTFLKSNVETGYVVTIDFEGDIDGKVTNRFKDFEAKSIGTIKVVDAGTATQETTSDTNSSTITKWTTATVAKYNVSIKNDSMQLNSMIITWSKVESGSKALFDSVIISYNGKKSWTINGQVKYSWANEVTVSFNNVSFDPDTYTFEVKANLSESVAISGIVMNYAEGSGTVVTVNKEFEVASAQPRVSLVETAARSMKLKITKIASDESDSLYISGLKLNGSFNNEDSTNGDAKVKVYVSWQESNPIWSGDLTSAKEISVDGQLNDIISKDIIVELTGQPKNGYTVSLEGISYYVKDSAGVQSATKNVSLDDLKNGNTTNPFQFSK